MEHPEPIQRPVVVGIDGSEAAIEAAQWAADEAVARDVPLRLIYVVVDPAAPAPLAAVGNLRMELEYGETALRRASAAVTALDKPVKVETAMRRGSPTAELVAESADAVMICVGSTGIGRVLKALFGSTAAAVAERAHCPVAIIRSRRSQPETDSGFIVAAVGDASHGDEIVGWAMQEADLRHAPVLAVGSSGAEFDRLVQIWCSRYPRVKLHSAVSQTHIADFLTRFDWQTEIQLVVIGAAGADQLTRLSGPTHRIPGLRTEYPVLVVPPSVAPPQ